MGSILLMTIISNSVYDVDWDKCSSFTVSMKNNV